jgi:hypothetical protein
MSMSVFRRLFAAAATGVCLGGSPAGAEVWTVHGALGAPDQLKLSGSARIRHEGLHGHFRPGANPDQSVISLRTIVSAEYSKGDTRFGGELYDSRAWGGEADGVVTTGEVNTLELVQGYVAHDFTAPFGPGTSATVQAGRFTLNLGSRRLVAADDYRNTTNGYTGLRLDTRSAGGVTSTLIYVLPQVRLPDDLPSVLENKTNFDKQSFDLALWGGIVTAPVAEQTFVELGLFGFQEGDFPQRATRNRDLRTISTRIIRNPRPGRFDFEIEAAYQFGSIRADTTPAARKLDVSASFLHLDAGYSYSASWKPRVSVEYDRASGDDSKATFGRYDTLFGMRRADLAPAGIYAALGRSNISTPSLRLEVTPNSSWDAFMAFRGLWLESATDSFSTSGVRDASGRSGLFAGRQLEGRVRHWLIRNALRLEINGVWLDRAGVLKRAPTAPRTGDTLYLSTAVTATF